MHVIIKYMYKDHDKKNKLKQSIQHKIIYSIGKVGSITEN